MTDKLNRAQRHLHMEISGGERRLTNTSPHDIRRLVHSSFTMHFDIPEDGDATVSRRPYYEYTGLPSGASVTLEEIDPYEDGHLTHCIHEVEWSDGLVEEGGVLQSMQRFLIELAVAGSDDERREVKESAVPITRHVQAERRFIRAEESRVLRSDPDDRPRRRS
jgi:hypothetical protein